MRIAGLLTVALLAACGGGKASSSGPAWPKSAGWETPKDWKEDGGESLAPQVPDEVAAVEISDEPTAEGGTKVTVEVSPALPTDAPTPPPEPPVEFVPEETIIIEGEIAEPAPQTAPVAPDPRPEPPPP